MKKVCIVLFAVISVLAAPLAVCAEPSAASGDAVAAHAVPFALQASSAQLSPSAIRPLAARSSEVTDERIWNFIWLIGMGFPYTKYEIRGEWDGLKQNAVDFDTQILLVNKNNGLTCKLLVDLGASETKGHHLDSDKTDSGLTSIFDFGVGITPVRKEHFLLSITGITGIGYTEFGMKETIDGEYSSRIEHRRDDSVFDFHIGADITAVIPLSRHFGLYGNIGVRTIIAGSNSWSTTVETSSWDDSTKVSDSGNTSVVGGTIVTPSFGIRIR